MERLELNTKAKPSKPKYIQDSVIIFDDIDWDMEYQKLAQLYKELQVKKIEALKELSSNHYYTTYTKFD